MSSAKSVNVELQDDFAVLLRHFKQRLPSSARELIVLELYTAEA